MALITKSEIAKHREISRGVRDDKINPFIEDAELLDLKPLLGSSLYFDLVKNKTDQKYIELLEPTEYDVKGVTYQHQGLSKVLSIFAFSRYVLFGSYTDTSFGFVEKNHQDSEKVQSDTKKIIYTKDKQTAIQYFKDIAFFLDQNKSTYPYWRQGCVSKSTGGGFRISKIS